MSISAFSLLVIVCCQCHGNDYRLTKTHKDAHGTSVHFCRSFSKYVCGFEPVKHTNCCCSCQTARKINLPLKRKGTRRLSCYSIKWQAKMTVAQIETVCKSGHLSTRKKLLLLLKRWPKLGRWCQNFSCCGQLRCASSSINQERSEAAHSGQRFVV